MEEWTTTFGLTFIPDPPASLGKTPASIRGTLLRERR
jgi:hypothetical protein